MTQEFITYEQALALNKLGFNEPCFTTYDDEGRLRNPFDYYRSEHHKRDISYIEDSEQFLRNEDLNPESGFILAPLKQQAFRWFREKHKLWAYNIPYSNEKYCIEVWRLCEGDDYAKTKEDRVIMDSWEEAEQACLDKLIEICKNKQHE